MPPDGYAVLVRLDNGTGFDADCGFRRSLADPDAGDGQTACNGGIKRGIVMQAEVAAEPDKDVSRFHEHVPNEKGETILSESASCIKAV